VFFVIKSIITEEKPNTILISNFCGLGFALETFRFFSPVPDFRIFTLIIPGQCLSSTCTGYLKGTSHGRLKHFSPQKFS
jgi:hypothetical protein